MDSRVTFNRYVVFVETDTGSLGIRIVSDRCADTFLWPMHVFCPPCRGMGPPDGWLPDMFFLDTQHRARGPVTHQQCFGPTLLA